MQYPDCGVPSFDEAREVFDIAFTNGFTDFAVNQKIIESWRGKSDSEPLSHEKIIEEIRSTMESSAQGTSPNQTQQSQVSWEAYEKSLKKEQDFP